MKRIRFRTQGVRGGLLAVIVVLAGLVAGIGVPITGTQSAAAAPYCGITWGSAAKSAGKLSEAPLINTRTGRHRCFDRVVFVFAGDANGYSVRYGEARTEGEGQALSPYTAGGALLSVNLRAPSYDSGHQPTVSYRAGDHVANVLRYRTLRDVVFGGSFEGRSTFAVGVRARLPYRVFVLDGPGDRSRIVIDIAHQW